jgi:hypothetical protein
MNARRKGTRRTRSQARPSRSLKWLGAVVAVGAVAAIAVVAALLLLPEQDDDNAAYSGPSAAIIDQLSLTAPNPDFAGEATKLLVQAGYHVDYVPGEEVTVDYYKRLPAHEYDLILLRAHASGHDFASNKVDGDPEGISLFTSEAVTADTYSDEKEARLVRGVGYAEEQLAQGDILYGITPAFVRSELDGDFRGATLVLMGCDLLRADNMAEAFISRGIKTVVGWNESVTPGHTDLATLQLLERTIEQDEPIEAAVAAVAQELGPDPLYGGEFLVHSGSD